MRFTVHENEKDDADEKTSENHQRDHACRKNDTCRNCPEQKCDIQRLLDGGTETHDGKSSHHAQ